MSIAALRRFSQELEASPGPLTTLACERLREMYSLDRVRFYESIDPPFFHKESPGGSEALLVLTYQIGHQLTKGLLGLAFATSETSLAPPFLARVLPDAGYELSRKELDLGLAKRQWLEVPVVAGGVLLGKIAGDWKPGRDTTVSDEDLATLSLFGSIVGNAYVANPLFAGAVTEELLSSSRANEPNQSVPTAERATARLREISDSAVAGLFEYQFQTGELKKIAHTLADRLKDPPWFDETYHVGEYLTGQAWLDPALRYVPAFEQLGSQASTVSSAQPSMPILVNPVSVRWHENVLKKVRTVQYAGLGHNARNFFVRFINRDSQPDLPWLEHRRVLKSEVHHLGHVIDAAVASEATEVAAVLAERLLDPARMVAPTQDFLSSVADLGVDVFALVELSESAPRVTASRGLESLGSGQDLLDDLANGLDLVEVLGAGARESNPPLSAVSTDQTFLILSIENGIPSALTTQLLDAGFRQILVIKCTDQASVSLLLIPLVRLEDPDASLGFLQAHQRVRIDALKRCAAIYSTNLRRAPMESAPFQSLAAFAFVQHELSDAFTVVARDGLELVLELRNRVLDTVEPYEMNEIDHRFHRLDAYRAEVKRVFGDLPLVSPDGSIQLRFALAPLDEVVADAVERTRNRFPVPFRLAHDISNFRIEVDLRHEQRELVCDRERLAQAIVLLLDNAVKYSIPKAPQDPVTIRVRSRSDREGGVYIAVSNFGLRIPHHRDGTDGLFQQFARGWVSHERRAIPGIGLGLYVARLLAEAHAGSISLTNHVRPKSSSRRPVEEGWNTTFEIALSRQREFGLAVYSEGTGLRYQS